MPLASQYRAQDRLFALFVGRSGSGKSVAAASFDRPLHDIDMDGRFGGIKSAMDQGIISPDEVSYDYFPPRSGDDNLGKFLDQQESYQMQGCLPYKTIVLDSITNLTRMLIITSHGITKGKVIGKLRISGPPDYNYEANATHHVFDVLRSLRCNIIASAHIIDKWGKADPSKEYSESGVIGERLSIRDNLGENVQTYFDNVWRFSRDVTSGEVHYYVEFATDLAKNSYGFAPGRHDITGKNFCAYFKEILADRSKMNLADKPKISVPAVPPASGTGAIVLPPPKRIV